MPCAEWRFRSEESASGRVRTPLACAARVLLPFPYSGIGEAPHFVAPCTILAPVKKKHEGGELDACWRAQLRR